MARPIFSYSFLGCSAWRAMQARVTAQLARKAYEQMHKDRPNDIYVAMSLAQAYAVMGEKTRPLLAERALILGRARDPVSTRMAQEHLATTSTIVGENSRATSILAELLQKPYWSYNHGPAAITSAHLRLDPLWDFCAAIRASKNSARKRTREDVQRHEFESLTVASRPLQHEFTLIE
jgi:hypothetical protein